MTKLETPAELEGFEDTQELLEANITDSVVPGICTRADCSYTNGVEPDQTHSYCEECGTNTVKSCLVLAGVI